MSHYACKDGDKCILLSRPHYVLHPRFRANLKYLKIDKDKQHGFAHHAMIFQYTLLKPKFNQADVIQHYFLKKTYTKEYTLKAFIEEYRDVQKKILFLCWALTSLTRLPKDILQIIISSVI